MRSVFAILMMVSSIGVAAPQSSSPTDGAKVPSCDALPGWSQQGANRLYEGESLFDYMDGNSEGYFIYGFVRMRGVTCTRGEQKLLIDVSEMRDDEGAYGLFSANRDVCLASEQIGAAGQIVPRKAIFVKGKYFVEIAAQSEGDFTPLLREVANAIEACLRGSRDAPAPIAWFPVDGMTGGPPRLVPESVLGIRLLERGYVAEYGGTKAFIVSEASSDAAQTVMSKLRTRFGSVMPVPAGDDAFATEDRYLGHLCIARRGRRLAGYAQLPGDADAAAIVRALLTRIPD